LSQLTVLTLVPDAGDRLARCLASVQWADHIFCVVDERTSDGSDSVALEYTPWVVRHAYENAAAQRNWALPQITTEWTLVLDADEWVSPALRERIAGIMADPHALDGYNIKRESWFMGRKIRGCGWQRDYNLRLFRTAKGRYLDKRVHSKVVVEGGTGRIEEPMYHDTYRSLDEYFRTFHRFTTWGAQDAFERGKRARWSDLLLRPVAKFFKMYLLRRGYRDGYHGAVLSMLGAFSVFAKYARLWQLQREAAGLPSAPPSDPAA
jgi:(heptosyl)LPS beta-1,4-glucosyltransferase